ncbi:hypothetical protein [Actinoalloteichus hymeniacidonis]|uniref:Uncharacterized protein n=1 Tax=Actinoalloteichus hymeniacidonis TaxID=340345 RepID=A0AAC9HNZ0_9PSEU|nr:hypothetical protein [Actinoalloteichus hymeniacidonis]AOS62286.1 hypothetical protein TL08_07340 [Actinoalloteichus hymeniacidonis]MBB5909688.1 hypothetical protein [Actinoalloteichus hymeniacidonis]
MNEHDSVRDALDETTADIAPSPTFANRVVAGARRRRRTGRILAVATTIVALSATGLALPALLRETNGLDVAQAGPSSSTQQWLQDPTRGDLADDQAFLDLAIETWQQEAPGRYPRDETPINQGEPHVVVAAETEAGPVAVVAQEVEWSGGPEVVSGVLATPSEGSLELLMTRTEFGDPLAYLLGPDRRTLLVVSPTTALDISTEIVIDDHSGRPDPRAWMEFSLSNGLALHQLSSELEPADVLLRTLGDNGAEVPLASVIQPWIGVGSGTPYHEGSDEPALDVRLRQGWAPESGDQNLALDIDAEGDALAENGHDQLLTFDREMTEAGLSIDDYQMRPASLFTMNVRLSDGRRALIAEQLHTPERAHLYAVVYDQDVVEEIVHAGPTPRESALPVSVRLPDEQGWVVFDYLSDLRYRDSPESEWQDVTTEWGAALLPASAGQVEVTDTEGDVTVVDLADRPN